MILRIIILLGVCVGGLQYSVAAESVLPIFRESLKSGTAFDFSTVRDVPVEPSPEDIEEAKGARLRDILPVGKIDSIIVPFGAKDIPDEAIERALWRGVLTSYDELSPVHLLPCTTVTVKMQYGDIYYLCLFPKGNADDRGKITLPDHKTYWFSIRIEDDL